MIERIAMVGLAWLAVASCAGAAEVRPEHPRIFSTREMILALKQRCQTTHKQLVDRPLAGSV